MNALNHAATGAVIAFAIKEPTLVLPLALASHYVLDSMPHFGFHNWQERKQHLKLMRKIFIIDNALFVLFIAFLLSQHVPGLVYLAGLFAILPDFAWVYRFAIPERMGTREPGPALLINRFHSELQTREFPNGFYVEYAYGLGVVALLSAVWL